MSALFRTSFLFLICIFLPLSTTVAQDDPDPNSPTPTIYADSLGRVIIAGDDWRGVKVPRISQTNVRLEPRSRLMIFLGNLELIDGEGLNSLRVFLLQKSGKTYELKTLEISRLRDGATALRVIIEDRDGYRGQPKFDGESVIYATWRGLVTNPSRITLGKGAGTVVLPEYLKSVPKEQTAEADFAGYRWSGDRARFLEQATFGASTEVDNRLRRTGLRIWLNEQFNAPYPTNQYPEIPLMPTTPPSGCSPTTNATCFRERYTMQPLQQWFFKEAFYGNSPLKHRVAWALSQIWVTSGVTIQQSSHMIAYHKILSNHAFGNYRDLMREMTLNPAMGHYLDMAISTKTNPNENYPREILQLFSVGLNMLNQDGTLQRDGQNNPIPTYSQDTVNNLAKVLTGWTYCNGAECPNRVPGAINYVDPMSLATTNHDTTAKTLLSYPNVVSEEIAACATCTTPAEISAYANSSLDQALDNIFNHPNLGPFVGRLLIQHLVTSDPSPAYVERIAGVFANNGQNVRGDLKAVVRAILLDPEARGNVKTAPRYGKLREPVQVVTNLARMFPARSWDNNSLSDGGLSNSMIKMGQNPFYSPTVFNYFTPDYVVPGNTLNAPEFQILNTSTAISRTNFLHTLIFEGVTPNNTDSLRGTSLDLTEPTAFAEADQTAGQLMDFLNTKMMHGRLTNEQRSAILTAVLAVPASNHALRTRTAVYLLAASSQFQVQR